MQPYISTLPTSVHLYLEQQLEWGSDLEEIADCMHDWEGKLASRLQLTAKDVQGIKASKPELQK